MTFPAATAAGEIHFEDNVEYRAVADGAGFVWVRSTEGLYGLLGVAVGATTPVPAVAAHASGIVQSNGNLRPDSFGIASVTKTGVGDYEVNLSTPVSNAALSTPVAVAAAENNPTIVNAFLNNTSQVRVLTNDDAGVATDRWFNIVVYDNP